MFAGLSTLLKKLIVLWLIFVKKRRLWGMVTWLSIWLT